ncbi:hypothetical protein PA905_39100 [Planktothrix agardhii CCAP 1459/11A]|uniref:DUF5009 domain-containing protein n=1 Tax=Planktothrix agardhii CCAP 1459/11A TaxID=282420 RepID=A0A479ZXV8_PLAAG|nr:DUF5009 domain-containing protein [Planktothrix agardhii]GCL34684.1 hypothetical protein PA905_39100 [Planktothrix agardhii CCAP 1459/11A]
MKLAYQYRSSFPRIEALDALRGIAVLGMVLSGVIPFNGTLPPWMYHAQFPPPNHQFNPKVSGLTWVDLVFPIFLFSLGIAIPLALSRRLSQGWKTFDIIIGILKRGFLLATFAIVLQHFRPTVISPETNSEKWQLALIGFMILFLMFVQLPKFIPKWLNLALNLMGWGAAIAILTQIQYPHDPKFPQFSLYRSDIILLVLTNIIVFTSLIWLFTRNHPQFRIGLLGVLFGLILSKSAGGWMTDILSISPIPWLYQFEYLKYLFIAIPGTFIGEEIINYQQVDDQDIPKNWNRFRLIGIMILMGLIILNLLIGLQTRLLPQTTGISLILLIFGYRLVKEPNHPLEMLLYQMYQWGIYGLILGLAFEPYQGGIKKDPATMSYFFITTAIAIFLLMILTILIDGFQQKLWFQLFIDNGKNPMIGYIAFANLLWPILELKGWTPKIEALTNTPTLGFLRGLSYTIVIALFVSLCTRLKLFWKT